MRPPICVLLILLSVGSSVLADEVGLAKFDREFVASVLPLIESHCLDCHDAKSEEAGLDLSRYRRASDVNDSHDVWGMVLSRLESGDMPPSDADASLGPEDRRAIAGWIRELRSFEADRRAGDPGIVLARRLSNAEFDHSIRDLTGIDLRPTKTFPIDPANEAGFDNSGESLSMSPALLSKYIEAVRSVVEHLVLTLRGIRFAPHPVVTDTDRDKYCVNRIVNFYRRQPTDLAAYFIAARDYRRALGDEGQPTREDGLSLGKFAERHSISELYLQSIWTMLNDASIKVGPLANVRRAWNEIDPDLSALQVRQACEQIRDDIIAMRQTFVPKIDNLRIDGVHKGTQAFVLWKNKQYASYRRRASRQDIEFPPDVDPETYAIACDEFCALFPDAFFVSERGRDYLGKPRDEQEKGRLLSAGFHSMMGYFRDDQPLMDLILDASGREQLDALWRELDFVTSAPMRQYQGFLWFDRTDSPFMRDPQFDFARPEDPQALSEPIIRQLGDVYLAKAKQQGGEGEALRAIEDYFREINDQIRWVEQARLAAQPKHLEAVFDFAERAFRGEFGSRERQQLASVYEKLRDQDDLSHEESIGDLLALVMLSPRFCYRLDLLSETDAPRALTARELASRLSFFLWASIPDAELMRHARSGDLIKPNILRQQTRRMLVDPRVRGLATEFAGNWLDIRQFKQHNSVDRERFPMFNDQLREAMFEEPIRFFVDLVQRDASVKELLYADRTFVNAVLAKHYGMDDLSLRGEQWCEVTDATAYGRGGLLPMAAFLTKNSPGLRTSPVKRGYWVVRRLLGERIPPPPPDVPELPSDEAELGEMTLREALAQHRDHASCAGCHDRFDSIGLAFEGFGPIGERRSKDLGGRSVETDAEFPDGSRRAGMDGLRQYLREQREQEFVDNFCRKLLSFGLSRTLILSDESLVETMKRELESNDNRIGMLVESIVTSPQFLKKRGQSNGN